MRYLVGFMFVLAVVISPQSASARAGEEGTATEPHLEEPAPSSEPAVEEGGSRLARWHPEAFGDPLGADVTEFEIEYVTPTPLQQMELEAKKRRTRRIAIGVSVSVVLVGFAAGMTGYALSSLNSMGP